MKDGNGDVPVCYVNVYQRVSIPSNSMKHLQTIMFLWFSYGFPHVFSMKRMWKLRGILPAEVHAKSVQAPRVHGAR